jgi:hypothetical protein
VYGIHTSSWAGKLEHQGGLLLDADADISECMHSVADSMGFDENIAERCIAKLPPEEIE